MKTLTHVRDDYEVGYGKPPEHTRFKKGQSGNPKGRKKQSLLPPDWQDPVKAMMRRKIPVTLEGKRMMLPTYEVILMKMVQDALGGCTKTQKILLDQTNGFQTLIEEDEHEATLADQEFLDSVKRDIDQWRGINGNTEEGETTCHDLLSRLAKKPGN
jgi:hypothetical protein